MPEGPNRLTAIEGAVGDILKHAVSHGQRLNALEDAARLDAAAVSDCRKRLARIESLLGLSPASGEAGPASAAQTPRYPEGADLPG